MNKILVAVILTLSAFNISCNEQNEFTQDDILSKIENGTATQAEIDVLTPSAIETEDILVQMDEDINEDLMKVKEPVKEVLATTEVAAEECSETNMIKNISHKSKKHKKRAYNRATTKRLKAKKMKSKKVEAEEMTAGSEEIVAEEVMAENETLENNDMNEVVIKGKACRKLAHTKMAKTYKCKNKKRRPQSLLRKMTKKYIICHVPNGNEAEAKTLALPLSAITAHIGNMKEKGSLGYMGPCKKDIQ